MLKEILYDWGTANADIFYAVNQIQGGEWYEKFMLLGTTLGDYRLVLLYVAMIMAIVGYVGVRKQGAERKEYLLIWGSLVSVMVISYGLNGVIAGGIKYLAHFPRPFKALPEGSVHIIGGMMDSSRHYQSFTSAHSAFSMLLVAGLWPVLRGIGKFAGIFFVLWVGISRLAVGAHFPMDVLSGYCIGLMVVLAVRQAWEHYILPRLQHRII